MAMEEHSTSHTPSAGTPSESTGQAAARAKRTRGPRSCLECRSSKQRCEQMNFAAIVPSSQPQPPHMACRRCRVLQLACIVPDQLPKSTRLRIERSQSMNMALAQTMGAQAASNDPSAIEAPAYAGMTSSASMHMPGTSISHHTQAGPRSSGSGSHSSGTVPPSSAPTPWSPVDRAQASQFAQHQQSELPLAPPTPRASSQVYLPTYQQQPEQLHSAYPAAGVSDSTGYSARPVYDAPTAGLYHQASEQGEQRMMDLQRVAIDTADVSSMSSAHTSSFGAYPQGIISPSSSSMDERNTQGASATGSSPSAGQALSSHFIPTVFDPLPTLKSGSSRAVLPSSSSSPTASFLPPLTASRSGHAVNAVADSPQSQTSGSSSGESSWFYRARIACRPAQLLEHMLASTPGFDTMRRGVPSLLGLPSLEVVIRHLASNSTYLTNVARRIAYLQGALPFLPSFHDLMDDVERGAFLIGVSMYLEGCIPPAEERALHDHLAARCAFQVEQPSDNVIDLCALIVVAIYCPLLMADTTLVGVVAGNGAFFAALRAANMLGFASAPRQLSQYLDAQHNMPLPAVDSSIVQNASIWVYLGLHIGMLELLDEPMPHSARTKQPRHPQASPSAQSLPMATQTDFDYVQRYYRMVLEMETTPASHEARDDTPSQAPPSAIALRCASMLLLTFGARETLIVNASMHSFTLQFDEQVRQVAEASARTASLRRWTDQVVDTIGMHMANARDGLHSLATYLGARRVVSANQLKYFELSLAVLEFTCMCRMKDKLYLIGTSFLGLTRTSQDFLFGLFSRPQLLKSFEHLGVVRACVAKHVLTLWSNLALDLQPIQRKDRRQGGIAVDNAAARAPISAGVHTGDRPLAHWGPLGHVFPVTRWCGMFMSCATVIVEELAGRFLAQEAPWGAQGESRLEVYQMVLRQTYDSLILFEDDSVQRYPSPHRTGANGGAEGEHGDHEQVRAVRVTLDALEKTLAALETWRKRASGIGQYGRSFHLVNHLEAAMTGRQPEYASRPASRMSGSQTSKIHLHHASHTGSTTGSHHKGPSYQQAGMEHTVHFGDALLHDILFTPIEQFFGTAT